MQRNSLLLLALFILAGAQAQGFTQTIGGLGNEDGCGAWQVGQSYAVAAREFRPVDQQYIGSILSLSGTGGFLANVTLPTGVNTFVQNVVNATDGAAFIVGSVLRNAPEDHDALLIKMDANGNQVWSNTPALPDAQQYWGGVALNDGGVVACGITNGVVGHQVLISRINASGTMLWSHTIPSATPAEAYAVAFTGNDLMITGRLRSFGGLDDILLLRMDLDGAVIWTSAIAQSGHEQGRSIIAQNESTFLLAGWTNSFGTFDHTTQRIPDHAFLAAVDLDGDTLWTRAIGDTTVDQRAFAVTQAPNGDLYLCGDRQTSGLSDAYLTRTSPSGDVIWQRVIDTGKEESLVHLLPLPDGVVATGRSFGPFSGQVLFIQRNAAGF